MSVQTISTAPAQRRKMSARTRDRLLSIISPLALLLLWELCARFGFIDTRFFPAPSSVMATMYEMLKSGELVTHTAVSMERLALRHHHRRHSGARARHRDGAQPPDPRAVRSAGRRDLSGSQERHPAARAAHLRARRSLEDLHGGDRRVLPGGDQHHHRRARDQQDLSRRRAELQSEPLEHVLDDCAARRAAGDHDRLQARHRHRARADRGRRDGRRQERARLPDLERVEHVRGRADVCRPVRDRDHRLPADARLERARARHHSVEDRTNGRRALSSPAQNPDHLARHAPACRRMRRLREAWRGRPMLAAPSRRHKPIGNGCTRRKTCPRNFGGLRLRHPRWRLA